MHSGVLEVGAVGVPDASFGRSGEDRGRAQGSGADAEEIMRAFCREHLTGYKMPKHIVFRNELPKTNVGKILRRALRDEVAKKI